MLWPRNLIGQVKQPYKLARLASSLLLHPDGRVASVFAVSSVVPHANTLDMTGTQKYMIPCAPFGCSVFGVGRVGTYRTASSDKRQ
jgi:hypothetical protein